MSVAAISVGSMIVPTVRGRRETRVLTLSASMGMIRVLEITLIVPTLRVGMPLRTLRVRS